VKELEDEEELEELEELEKLEKLEELEEEVLYNGVCVIPVDWYERGTSLLFLLFDCSKEECIDANWCEELLWTVELEELELEELLLELEELEELEDRE